MSLPTETRTHTVALNFINFQTIFSLSLPLSLSLCVLVTWSIGNPENPRCISYLRVALSWLCSPDPLTSMFPGDRVAGNQVPFLGVKRYILCPDSVRVDAWTAAWLPVYPMTKFACPCLNGVCWHGSRGRGTKKKKDITPLLRREGGQHGMAELTNQKSALSFHQCNFRPLGRRPPECKAENVGSWRESWGKKEAVSDVCIHWRWADGSGDKVADRVGRTLIKKSKKTQTGIINHAVTH